MRKLLLNFMIILLASPIILMVAVIGGIFSVLYYFLFYMFAKLDFIEKDFTIIKQYKNNN